MNETSIGYDVNGTWTVAPLVQMEIEAQAANGEAENEGQVQEEEDGGEVEGVGEN